MLAIFLAFGVGCAVAFWFWKHRNPKETPQQFECTRCDERGCDCEPVDKDV